MNIAGFMIISHKLKFEIAIIFLMHNYWFTRDYAHSILVVTVMIHDDMKTWNCKKELGRKMVKKLLNQKNYDAKNPMIFHSS